MARPLDGVLVVSMEQAVAAPFVSSRLADAGARVIKIERAGGDFARRYDTAARGLSSYFVWLNRGKQSVVLDIKDPEDAALLARMIARADVFIQNLSPGAMERAGFGSADLRRRHPSLITCDISGYGESGPYRDMKAYDLLIQGETGLAAITGAPEAPGRVGVSVCDIACGLYAHAAIVQALYARERTGAGAGLQISLFDSLADWMAVPLAFQDHLGQAPARVGLHHPSIAPYGAYPTADAGQIIFSVQNPREWPRFCTTVLERPALTDDPRFTDNDTRVANRTALDAIIRAVFETLDRETVAARLDAASIAYGRLNSVADLSAHPQLRRLRVETENGPVDLPANPIREDGSAPTRVSAVPAVDADGAAIRDEFAPSPATRAGD